MKLTPDLAYAAGKDAANARMRKAGRTTWNEADYNLCCDTINRLLDQMPGPWNPHNPIPEPGTWMPPALRGEYETDANGYTI